MEVLAASVSPPLQEESSGYSQSGECTSPEENDSRRSLTKSFVSDGSLISFAGSFASFASTVSSYGGSNARFSRQDSMFRHQRLLKRWKENLSDLDQSAPNINLCILDITETSTQLDSFGFDDPPFHYPFDLYDLLDKNNLDGLVRELKTFLVDSDHSMDDWRTRLKWNNYEILRVLSTRADSVSEPFIDSLMECILTFLEIDETRFASPLVTSTLMGCTFSSLQSPRPDSLLLRLRVLYILFCSGGQAFPDISFQNCRFLINLCTHKDIQVRILALTTSILGYYRMQSESLWQQLQTILSLECIEGTVQRCLQILTSEDPNDTIPVHIVASLEWISCCFQYNPTTYYNLNNYQTTTDVLLGNLGGAVFELAEEEIICKNVECLKTMLGWPVFFESNYKCKETLKTLNETMTQGGQRNYTKLCETVSQALNEHLDKLNQGGLGNDAGGDLVVFE